MERHPLLIESIVMSITQYIKDYKTLQSLRLVHPSWNNSIVTPNFLSKSILDINLKEKDMVQLLTVFPTPIDKYNPFLPRTVAVSHLKSSTDEVYFLKFWFKRYGSRINHLEINKKDLQVLISEVSLREPIAHEWCGNPPYSVYTNAKLNRLLLSLLPLELLSNLESLRIPVLFNTIGDKTEQTEPLLPRLRSLEISTSDLFLHEYVNIDSVNIILNSAPKLQSLKLRIEPGDHTCQYLRGLYSDLFYGIQPHYLSKLVELDLTSFAVGYRQLQLLATVPFENLKKLSCSLIKRVDNDNLPPHPSLDMAEGEFQKLLGNVKTTLESSTAYVNWLFNEHSKPDAMLKLKFVKNAIHPLSMQFSLGNMNILEDLPNLEELYLEYFGHSERMIRKLLPPDLLLNNHSLKILSLQNIAIELNPFKRLVKAFPHLESLSIGSKSSIYGRDDPIEHKLIWDLEEFLNELKDLKKLTALDFLVYCDNQIKNGHEFWEVISKHLPELLVLKKCTIVCHSGSIELKNVKKLRFPPLLGHLKLKYFTIKPRVQKVLHESLKQKKIHWDFIVKRV